MSRTETLETSSNASATAHRPLCAVAGTYKASNALAGLAGLAGDDLCF